MCAFVCTVCTYFIVCVCSYVLNAVRTYIFYCFFMVLSLISVNSGTSTVLHLFFPVIHCFTCCFLFCKLFSVLQPVFCSATCLLFCNLFTQTVYCSPPTHFHTLGAVFGYQYTVFSVQTKVQCMHTLVYCRHIIVVRMHSYCNSYTHELRTIHVHR